MSTELTQGAGVGQAAGGGNGQGRALSSGQAATGSEGGTIAAGASPRSEGQVQPIAGAAIADASLRSEGQPGQAQPQRVDLTQLPEFRAWQAGVDRREAQMRAQFTQQQQQMAQELQGLRFQMQQAQLADADPEQVAEFYRTQYEQMQQQTTQQAQQVTLADIVTQAGYAYLDALELAHDTPGLDWGAAATLEQLPRLMASARALADQRAATAGAQGETALQAAVRQAKIDALDAAGVTHVAGAVGSGGAGQNPISDITDATELLQMAWGKKGQSRG